MKLEHIGNKVTFRPIVGAVAVAAVMVAGVTLPLDFLSEIDAYLIYVRPWELLPIFAWSWLFYFLLGIVLGGITVTVVVTISILIKPARTTELAKWVGNSMVLSIPVLGVMKGARTWFRMRGFERFVTWQVANHWAIVGIVVIGCGIVTWRHPGRHEGIKLLGCIGASCGLLLTTIAPLVVLLHPDDQIPIIVGEHGDRVSQEVQPNIILITLDAFAANHSTLYGYKRQTTPSLEQLGMGAHVFERFYANSNFTTPTTNSFINGVRPWTHRTNELFSIVDSYIADKGMIARLKRAGYQTYAVATNPAADPIHNRSDRWLDESSYGNIHTIDLLIFSIFDEFHFTHVEPALLNLTTFSRVSRGIEHALILLGIWSNTDQYDPQIALSAARRLILARHLGKPMFLWVHLFAPHEPYASPAPFLGRFDGGPGHRTRFNSSPPSEFLATKVGAFPSEYIGRYDEALAYEDYYLGLFLAWLKSEGLYEKTLLIISADHGESFGHGYGGHAGPMLYEDVIHIPLIIKEPGQMIGDRRSELSEQIDLMPTVMDFAGIPIGSDVEGRSLRQVHDGDVAMRAVYSMNFEQTSRFGALKNGSVAMLEGRWKYVHFFGKLHYSMMPPLLRILPNLEDSLYDLSADPKENKNRILEQPLMANRMRSSIEMQLRIHDRAPGWSR